MNIKEDIKPVSYIKSHAAAVLKYINEKKRPVIITQNGEAKGVFIDSDTYQNMKNTMSLMKMLLIAENQVSQGQTIEQNQLFKKLDKKFEDLK